MKCPTCLGKKKLLAHLNRGIDATHSFEYIECIVCKGTGEITEEHFKKIQMGKELRKARIERGETLFNAAKRQKLTSAQLSAIENGRN